MSISILSITPTEEAPNDLKVKFDLITGMPDGSFYMTVSVPCIKDDINRAVHEAKVVLRQRLSGFIAELDQEISQTVSHHATDL